MSVQYAGGTRANALSAVFTTRNALADFIKDNCVTAGWTSAVRKSGARLDYTAQPTNAQTITLDGSVYTYKTAIINGNPREVLIGATAGDTYDNLRHCVNDDGVGEGTLYSNTTVAHTTISSTSNTGPGATGTILFESLVGGLDKDFTYSTTVTGATQKDSAGNPGLSTQTRFWGGGYTLTSAITAQGLKCQALVIDCGDTATGVELVRLQIWNQDATMKSHTAFGIRSAISGNADFLYGAAVPVSTGAGYTFRIIANKFQFAVFREGFDPVTESESWFMAGVPFIPAFLEGKIVSAASNATPIQITTTVAHGFSNGNNVFIEGVAGNTAANGLWTITFVDASNFTLNTSVGNGAYTSGGRAGKLDVNIAGAIYHFAKMDNGPATEVMGRNAMHAGSGGFTGVNGQFLGRDADPFSGVGSLAFIAAGHGQEVENDDLIWWYDGSYAVSEAFVASGISAAGTIRKMFGQLWDAIIVQRDFNTQNAFTFDSQTWLTVTLNSDLATTGMRGTLALVTG